MSQINIDPRLIETAQSAVELAESRELATRSTLNDLEDQKKTLRINHRQACYDHHMHTSASGLYMTAYGSTPSHLQRCNENMDRKEELDRNFDSALKALQLLLNEAERMHDISIQELETAKYDLIRAQRGF